MKILFLRPRAEMGGAARVMLVLASALQERGHTIILGSSGGEWFDQFEQPLRVQLYPSTPWNIALATWQITKIVRNEHIDVMHSHHRFSTLVGKIVSWITGIPLVSSLHEFKTNWRWIAPLWNARWICPPTEGLRQHLISHYKIAADRVSVIRVGVWSSAPDRLLIDQFRHSTGALASSLIGYVGRLAPEKGVDTLLRAMPEVLLHLPDARLVVIGDGSERQYLESLTQSLSLNASVTFIGARYDASQLMYALDVLVMPSLTEGYGLTAVEAMAAARPVIASNVGALPEVVEDGRTGYLVPPCDPNALARRIVDVLNNPVRAKAMGEAGKQKIEEWTPAKAAEAVEVLYRRAIAETVSHRFHRI